MATATRSRDTMSDAGDDRTIEAAYAEASGSWVGWEWAHDPGGLVVEGPGEVLDWDVWVRERISELRGDGFSRQAAESAADAERRYGEQCQQFAAAAESHAAAAMEAWRAGRYREAAREIERAASYEGCYGEAVTWRRLCAAIAGDLS